MKKWYEKDYRRSLIDMHIQDWDDSFLSQFDENDYLNNLKKANVQSAMIYVQSHNGLCYFPTKSAKMHKAFVDSNKIQRLIQMCKDSGISVVAYYSLIFNHWAFNEHPDWRMINERGKTVIDDGLRGGLVCPNNPDYRRFTTRQIEEIAANFQDLDGIFYDMVFWPVRCHCECCQKKFLEQTGQEIPKEMDWSNPLWMTFMKLREIWLVDFAKFVQSETNRILPGATMSCNFAGEVAFPWWAASTEALSQTCDYIGGDLYGDVFCQSFGCKYFLAVTQNQPFEYMSAVSEIGLSEHNLLKSEKKLLREVMLTMAHHGATLIIDAIDPKGTINGNVYDTVKNVFAQTKHYEPYLSGKHFAEVAVYLDTRSKFNSQDQAFDNKSCCLNLMQNLVENHIPAAVIANEGMQNLSQYKMIFASCLERTEAQEREKLIQYVKNGGVLYLSYLSDKALIREFFDAEFVCMTDHDKVYLRPEKGTDAIFGEFTEKFPVPYGYKVPEIRVNKTASVLARLTLPYTLPSDNKNFASIHSNPPGIDKQTPLFWEIGYGQGKVILSAAAIENEKYAAHKKIIINLIHYATHYSGFSVELTCSKKVEAVTFKDENSWRVGLVDLFPEDEINSYPYELRLISDKKPVSVQVLPQGEPVAFTYENKTIKILDTVEEFKMLKIDF